jgi:hypothetical protein
MSTSFHNLAAVYMMQQRTQEFERVREYVVSLGAKLNSVDKISQRIHKERQGWYKIDMLVCCTECYCQPAFISNWAYVITMLHECISI